VLLTTTDWVALVVPVRWLPNDTLVGLATITGAVTVPVRVTTEGLPDASCVIDSVALFAPRLVGVKVTEIVQLAPTATVVQPLVRAN
jgi:hypothetical protein